MSLLPSRRALRGYVAWAVMMAALAVGVVIYYHTRAVPADPPLTAEEAAAVDSLCHIIAADSASRQGAWERRFPEYASRQRRNYGTHGGYTPRAAETFPFDPNHCDSLTFLRLGLRPWQAHNALQYRRKGGVWRSAAHFSKLYGLSEADYRRLAPYVRIDSGALRQTPHGSDGGVARQRSEATNSRPAKYTNGEVVLDINTCDTTELQRIPDIGSYRARQIVSYREQLGGFVSVAQLREIPNLPAGLETWFSVGEGEEPDKINLNKATFQALNRHPYISYEQAREVVNYRRQYGDLKSLGDLRLSPHFTPADFKRLAPYVAF